jgi:epoxyqueuosine reductase
MAHQAQWFAMGCHGKLDYLRRRERIRFEPALFSPGARSVVMVAKAYPSHGMDGDEEILIARYARLKDYHRAMGEALNGLLAVIRSWGNRGRAFVDGAPIMEKVMAARCGLGVIGTHSLLIHPVWGSFVVLGGIITDAEFPREANDLVPGGCRGCLACVRACPMNAIRLPGYVDARRCLACWSVEGQDIPAGEIPASARRRLFGCDICQEVCPMNRDRPPVDPSFFGGVVQESWSANRWLSASASEFARTWGETPLGRCGLENIQSRIREVFS